MLLLLGGRGSSGPSGGLANLLLSWGEEGGEAQEPREIGARAMRACASAAAAIAHPLRPPSTAPRRWPEDPCDDEGERGEEEEGGRRRGGGEDAAKASGEKRGGAMGEDGGSGEENGAEWAQARDEQGWRLGF